MSYKILKDCVVNLKKKTKQNKIKILLVEHSALHSAGNQQNSSLRNIEQKSWLTMGYKDFFWFEWRGFDHAMVSRTPKCFLIMQQNH